MGGGGGRGYCGLAAGSQLRNCIEKALAAAIGNWGIEMDAILQALI